MASSSAIVLWSTPLVAASPSSPSLPQSMVEGEGGASPAPSALQPQLPRGVSRGVVLVVLSPGVTAAQGLAFHAQRHVSCGEGGGLQAAVGEEAGSTPAPRCFRARGTTTRLDAITCRADRHYGCDK